MKSRFKVSLIIFFSIALLIAQTWAPKPSGAEVDPNYDDLKQMSMIMDEFNSKFSDNTVADTQRLKKVSEDLIKRDKVQIKSNGHMVLEDAFSKKSKEEKILYIPLKHDSVRDDMDNSSLAIVFNKDNTLKSFMEYKLIGNDKNYTVDAAVYINGTLSKEQNVKLEAEDFVDSTDEYENITEGDQNAVAKFIQPVKVEAGFWSKFYKCLADKGVAAWAITSLSIVCGAACVGTAGAGCAACLVGAGLLTEGVVTYCLAKVVSK